MPVKINSGLKTFVIVLWLLVGLAAVGVGTLLVTQGVIPIGGAPAPDSIPTSETIPPPTVQPPSSPTLTPLAPAADTLAAPVTFTIEATELPGPTAETPTPSPSPTEAVPRQALIRFISPDGCHVHEIVPETGASSPLTKQAPAYICYLPKLSPDGTRLAFLMPGTNSTLYDMNVDGSGLRRISLGHIYDFAWSPDGSRLAYASLLPDQGRLGLVFINADGSGRTYSNYAGIAITPDAIHIAWSPDGQWVYAPVNDPTGADQSLPFALNANGVDTVQLSDRAVDPKARVSWSPDSRSLSFLINGYDYGYAVTLLNFLGLDGSPVPSLYYDDPTDQGPTLAPEGKFTSVPVWSTDGRWAALSGVSSLVAGEYQLLALDGTTRALQLVADLSQRADFAAWSPTGDRIAFLALADSEAGATAALNVVNLDGSGLQTLAGDVSASPPVWVMR